MTRAQQSGASNTVALLLAASAGLAVLATCSAIVSRVSSPASKDAADPGPAARAACRQFIERSLHDASSAEWIESWTWTTSQQPSGEWSVVAHYRAKNGFGALRKAATHCLMKQEGKDSWRLISKTTL